MRVVICWIGASGYMTACYRKLAMMSGIELKIILAPSQGAAVAPFGKELTDGLPVVVLDQAMVNDAAGVARIVVDFKPDIVSIPGWSVAAFNQLPMHAELVNAKFVMAIDTPWKGTWRQKLAKYKFGKLFSRISRIMVPGERGFQLARCLGFHDSQIRRGVYGVDTDQFSLCLAERMSGPWPKRFLFTGRYTSVKGVDVLMSAYAKYRGMVNEPWDLVCSGKGEMGSLLAGQAGVEDRGFVQPVDQPKLWGQCGVFVLPSRYDPWPLVITEAASAGLPVICTEDCGSAVELIRPFYNGLTIPSDDIPALADAMCWMHEHESELPEMGKRSMEFAGAYSAQVWAIRWLEMFREMRK